MKVAIGRMLKVVSSEKKNSDVNRLLTGRNERACNSQHDNTLNVAHEL